MYDVCLHACVCLFALVHFNMCENICMFIRTYTPFGACHLTRKYHHTRHARLFIPGDQTSLFAWAGAWAGPLNRLNLADDCFKWCAGKLTNQVDLWLTNGGFCCGTRCFQSSVLRWGLQSTFGASRTSSGPPGCAWQSWLIFLTSLDMWMSAYTFEMHTWA